MKKLFAVLALAGMIASCNSKKKDEKKDTTSDTTTTTTTNTTTTTTTTDNTSGDIPKFADAEVQQYVNDYTAWVTAYVAAYKSKDMTKISKVSGEAMEWGTRTQTVGMKLANNPDESLKFSNYMTKLSQDMAAAVQFK